MTPEERASEFDEMTKGFGKAPDKYDGHCLECKHWGGDQIKVYRDIENSGDVVMDKDKGWAGAGACALDMDWCDSEVDCGRYCQGGRAAIEVYAHFGCVYWQKLEPKQFTA